MAAKALSLFVLTLLLLALFPFMTLASSDKKSHEKSPSPSEFLQHIRGCHKGDNVKGIHNLKKYLEKFGYLHYSKNQSHAKDDNFDDLLEAAVKTYQQNYHLNVSGILDSKTVSQMTKPRCGVADIINGTNWMRSGKKSHQQGHKSNFHKVSHYAFFPGNPKWPPTKYQLSYAFVPGTRSDAITPVAKAFQTWAANSHFTFTQAPSMEAADITIGFYSGDHNDGAPFDGPGQILAHAWAPTDGRFHYDADETWSVGASPNAYDLETVALHEIGHLLGLGHSSVEGAIMWPSIPPGVAQGLHGDDIAGIKALYNF